MNPFRWGFILVSVCTGGLLSAPACDIAPDVGPLQQARCTDGDSDPATAVSFSADVEPLLSASCYRCHDPAMPNSVGTERSGLDLSSYDALRSGGGSTGTSIVLPSQPCGSLLYLKLLAGPPVGSRMPLGASPLTLDQLAIVHDWLAEGALDN